MKFPVNKLFHSDCFKILPDIPDEYVDLVLTDPPYNIGKGKMTFRKHKPVSTKKAWGDRYKDVFSEEEYLDMMLALSDQFYRVLKDGGSVLIFFDRSKPYYLMPFYDKFYFKNMMVFVKTDPPPQVGRSNYRSGFEQCAWFCKGVKPRSFNFVSQTGMKNVFHGAIGSTKEAEHPTEKRPWMIKPLIERHSNEGDLVLDTFIGSGSVPAYAKKLRRKYIGMEIDKEFFDAALARVNSVTTSLGIDKYFKRDTIDQYSKGS